MELTIDFSGHPIRHKTRSESVLLLSGRKRHTYVMNFILIGEKG